MRCDYNLKKSYSNSLNNNQFFDDFGHTLFIKLFLRQIFNAINEYYLLKGNISLCIKYFIHHSFLYDIITILSEEDLYQNDLHHFSNKIKQLINIYFILYL